MEDWEDIKNHDGYIINRNYPYYIIKKGNGKQVKETLDNGYYRVYLDGKQYFKHRVVADQWLPNPNNLSDVDRPGARDSESREGTVRLVYLPRVPFRYILESPREVEKCTFSVSSRSRDRSREVEKFNTSPDFLEI
jgi:hypothetical protein